MDVREYFKEVVADAQRPSGERTIFHSCNIPKEWFNPKVKCGRTYHYLLNPGYIDNLEDDDLKQELALFIANCYRQR